MHSRLVQKFFLAIFQSFLGRFNQGAQMGSFKKKQLEVGNTGSFLLTVQKYEAQNQYKIDEWPSAMKLISLEKVNLKCDSSEIVDKIK